jgi:hypothetical protein
MSTFVIEHEYKGYPVIEMLTGVEDIDVSMYKKILSLWVCETPEEISAVEAELRRRRETKNAS